MPPSPVLDTHTLPWKVFAASTIKDFDLKPGIIGKDYTDAYSVDLVRVAPGGYSDTHTDKGRHAFFIIQGQARIRIGEQDFDVGPGAVVKFPVDVPHSVVNTGAGELQFVAIYDPPRYREALA